MNRQRFLSHAILLVTLCSAAAQGAPDPKIYWNRKFSVAFGRCNLDGSDMQMLSVFGAQDIRRFAIHESLGSIYWADPAVGILCSSMNGTRTAVVTSQPTGSLRAVALDTRDGKVYWTDGGKIRRVDLDGTNVELLYDLTLSLEGLALDLKNHDLYATSWSTGDVIAAPMDGGTVRAVRYLVSTGTAGPEAIALDVKGNKMYWAHSGEGRIQRAALDGSKVETVVSGLTSPYGLDLDLDRRMVYWTDVTRIQRAAMEIPFGQTPANRKDIVTILEDLVVANDLHLNLHPHTPLSLAFTYQGVLKHQGRPVTGSYDMRFSLWADPDSTQADYQLGSTQTILAVDVSDGLFTVLLNSEGQFGPGVFADFARWLQIEVKGPQDPDFTLLSPRQLITPGPYSRN
jgi:hypothetical protein